MASSQTTHRLLRELKDYTNSPNEALLHLGPVDEDDLLHWEAVLKGVPGTPYESIPPPFLPTYIHTYHSFAPTNFFFPPPLGGK